MIWRMTIRYSQNYTINGQGEKMGAEQLDDWNKEMGVYRPIKSYLRMLYHLNSCDYCACIPWAKLFAYKHNVDIPYLYILIILLM